MRVACGHSSVGCGAGARGRCQGVRGQEGEIRELPPKGVFKSRMVVGLPHPGTAPLDSCLRRKDEVGVGES